MCGLGSVPVNPPSRETRSSIWQHRKGKSSVAESVAWQIQPDKDVFFQQMTGNRNGIEQHVILHDQDSRHGARRGGCASMIQGADEIILGFCPFEHPCAHKKFL